MSTRNDRDLVQRVRVLKEHLKHGVACLVVRGCHALLLLDLARTIRAAPTHLVARFFEVGEFNKVLVGHRGDDRCFVDERREIGAREHRRAACDLFKVDIFGELHLLRVDRENLATAREVRQIHRDGTVEATWACECRVEDVGTIGRRDDDDLRVRIETVHLDEDRVERLLALIVAARREASATTTTDRVDFVEEDDARRILLRLLEEVAHAAGADADEHFDEVRTRDRVEGDACFASDGLREQCLAAARRAREQHAARNTTAEFREALRVLEELDDLLDFFLRFVDACDVVERDLDGVL